MQITASRCVDVCNNEAKVIPFPDKMRPNNHFMENSSQAHTLLKTWD